MESARGSGTRRHSKRPLGTPSAVGTAHAFVNVKQAALFGNHQEYPSKGAGYADSNRLDQTAFNQGDRS
jgi:hypothetical protein